MAKRRNKTLLSQNNCNLFGIFTIGILCTSLGIFISEFQYHPPSVSIIAKLLIPFIFSAGTIGFITIISCFIFTGTYFLLTGYRESSTSDKIFKIFCVVSLLLGIFISLVDNPFNILFEFFVLAIDRMNEFGKIIAPILILIFIFYHFNEIISFIRLKLKKKFSHVEKPYIPIDKPTDCIVNHDQIKKGDYYFTCKIKHCISLSAFTDWYIQGKREQKCLVCHNQLFCAKN